jgi:tetratricopeptide (TPR) repeat protein
MDDHIENDILPSTKDSILPPTKPAESESVASPTATDQSGATDSRADKETLFLEERIRALRHEVDKLIEQRPLLLAALRYQHVGDLMRIALQGMFAVIGLVVVFGLIGAMWSAAHDDSLVIEAFSVPPDLAQRGLTGQVVASQLLDKLANLQDKTPTERAASTYSHNWSNDIRVAIPNTGLSVQDVNRLLRDWLGHETHITGEVYRTSTGIDITARTGGQSGETVKGSEADFDTLMQNAAESIYRRTQPYRYSVYIVNEKRPHSDDISNAVLRGQLDYGPPSEAKWAHLGLAANMESSEKFRETAVESRAALADDPAFGMAYNLLAESEYDLGHDEAALAALDKGLPLLEPGRDPQVTARAAAMLHARMDAQRSAALGDFRAAADKYLFAAGLPDYGRTAGLASILRVQAIALAHDGAANAAMDALGGPRSKYQLSEYAATMEMVPTALEDWPTALGTTMGVRAEIAIMGNPKNPKYRAELSDRMSGALPCRILPMAALAEAHIGDMKTADALIAQTPRDCYYAVRVRGELASIGRHWSDAARWFAEAAADAPSIPFAYAEWGRMLMTKGDLDGAIGEFQIANQKGPHFADPLEMWGEVLIFEKRSDLALAKFAEADKYAPNWGRLHLKWGEALFYAGTKVDSKREMAIAAGLFLPEAEKSELARSEKSFRS